MCPIEKFYLIHIGFFHITFIFQLNSRKIMHSIHYSFNTTTPSFPGSSIDPITGLHEKHIFSFKPLFIEKATLKLGMTSHKNIEIKNSDIIGPCISQFDKIVASSSTLKLVTAAKEVHLSGCTAEAATSDNSTLAAEVSHLTAALAQRNITLENTSVSESVISKEGEIDWSNSVYNGSAFSCEKIQSQSNIKLNKITSKNVNSLQGVVIAIECSLDTVSSVETIILINSHVKKLIVVISDLNCVLNINDSTVDEIIIKTSLDSHMITTAKATSVFRFGAIVTNQDFNIENDASIDFTAESVVSGGSFNLSNFMSPQKTAAPMRPTVKSVSIPEINVTIIGNEAVVGGITANNATVKITRQKGV